MLHMKLAGLFGLLFIFSSCIKNNPTPAWIEIDPWTLQANPLLSGAEGDLIHNFSDAYISIGGKVIGFFELPCKIPVLLDGTQEIMIYPAVVNNGISATKKIYPFCDVHKLTATLTKGETTHINPVTRYSQYSDFDFVEDFESAGIKFTTDTTSKATIEQVQHTDPGKTGYCGHISLTELHNVWTGYTHDVMVLPIGGAEVYLEIEYKTTNSLLTGVLAITLPGSTQVNANIQLNPQDPSVVTWRKTYIDLKEIVSASTSADYFEQYLQATIDPGKTSSEIYIDNIKVIHF